MTEHNIPNPFTTNNQGKINVPHSSEYSGSVYTDITIDDSFLVSEIDLSTSYINPHISINPSYSYTTDTPIYIGEDTEDAQKIYLVKPWQSRNPINITDGLYVSLERDLISNEEIKDLILKKLEDTYPEILLKAGINRDKIKLIKSEVNIEINKGY